ncbi:MAG: C40 family peptidase [Propionicimonas sp.]
MTLRIGRVVLGAVVAASLTVFVAPTIPANAEPSATPKTVKSAKDRVEELQAEAGQIGEDYNTIADALDKGKDELKVLNSDIAIQQKKVDQLNAEARTIALAQFRSRDLDTTLQIFTSDDPDQLLDRLSTASKVDDTMAQLLSEQQTEQANLTDMKRSAQAEVTALADQEKKLSELKDKADAKVAEAQTLYESLDPSDRQQVDNGDSGDTPDPGDIPDPGDYGDVNARVKKAIAYAVSKVGNSYVWGASGPNSFDCSGLMLAAYRKAGISLPHSSAAQAGRGRAVSKSKLRPGDLVFYAHGGRVYHVAMYIGGGKIVHARQPRYGIQINSLNGYSPVASARRIIG